MISRAISWLRARSQTQAGRASLYYASSSLTCQALRFAGVLITTRLIAAEQFGLFAQAGLVIGFSVFLREFGQTNGLVSYAGQDDRYPRFHLQLAFLTGLISATAAAVALHLWIGEGAAPLRSTAFLTAAVIFCEGMSVTGQVMAWKHFRFRAVGLIELLSVGSWLAVLVIGASRLNGLTALLLARLAEVAVRSGCLFLLEGRHYCRLARGKDLVDYYFRRFAAVMIPQIWLETAVGQLETILLSRFSTVAELGVLERAQQYLRIPLSLSVNLVDRVALAAYSRDQADRPALRKTFLKFSALILLCGLGAVAVFSGVLPFVFPALVGEGWSATLLPLWWVAIPFTLARPLAWNGNILMQGIGRPKELFYNSCVLAALATIFGVILVPRYGAAGMLTTWSAAYLGLLVFQTVRFLKNFPRE